MRWIWNDFNFFSKTFENIRITFKIELPVFIVLVFLMFIFLERLKTYEIILISFGITFFIGTIINLIFQLPHWKIPDDSSKEAKIMMYFFDIIFASLFLYIFSVGILQHYYPFFEELVCCDFIRNFHLDF